jgi:hypothetical protein
MPALALYTAKTHICHDASWLWRSTIQPVNARLNEYLEHAGMAVI